MSRSKPVLRFQDHYLEPAPASIRKLLRNYDNGKHKTALWNAFVDTDLSGINEDDCAIIPRVLPGDYLPVIQKTTHDLTLFALRLLSLPTREIEAILPHGPIRDFLISEIGVLKHHPGRLTGSFRFDMAIVGKPTRNNPPKVLELNEIGFDGLARSSQIQEILFNLIPDLRQQAFALDTAQAEARNMRRLGQTLTRFQYNDYNWEEEVLVRKAREAGVHMHLIAPKQFKFTKDSDLPLLSAQEISLRGGRIQVGKNIRPDALQMGFSFQLEDYQEAASLYGMMVRSKTPQYGPFITNLVASKIILVLLGDPALRRRLLGSARKLENVLLPAHQLQGHERETWNHHQDLVLKHVDGLGGQMVFIGADLRRRLKKIPPHEAGHWVVQKRTHLNTINVHGILSRPRRVIADLGVFVQYDWARGKFMNFGVGGFITRATNRSFKVNVSGGGLQVPVMFTRD